MSPERVKEECSCGFLNWEVQWSGLERSPRTKGEPGLRGEPAARAHSRRLSWEIQWSGLERSDRNNEGGLMAALFWFANFFISRLESADVFCLPTLLALGHGEF